MTTTLNFEGLADGVDFTNATIIAGSDAPSAVITLNGGTCKSDTDNEVYGTACVEFNAAGNITICRWLLPGSGFTEYATAVFFQYPDHTPDIPMNIHTLRSGTLASGAVSYRVKIPVNGNVATAVGTGGDNTLSTAAQMAALSWYRVESYLKQGSLATNGDHKAEIFPWNSLTKVAGSSTVNLVGTAPLPLNLITVEELGVGSVLAAPMTMRYDLTRSGSQSTQFGLAPSNTLPVCNAGVSQTGTVGSPITQAGSASDADGTIVSHVWAFTSTPSGVSAPSLPAAPSSATPSWTPTAPGVYDLTYHVVDNNGGVSPESVVTDYVPTTTPKFIAVVSNTGPWAAVGTADILAAFNDLSDATEVDSPVGGGAGSLRLRLDPMPTMTSINLAIKSGLSTAGSETATIKFWSAGVARKTWDPAPTTSILTTNWQMDATECATVTDWLRCDIEFIWGG